MLFFRNKRNEDLLLSMFTPQIYPVLYTEFPMILHKSPKFQFPEWEAMAAEQMTAMNRKRERDDKIAKLMGEYLLKGYKMLGSTCTVCGTILLRDRKQQDYCIGCSEVDNEFHAAPTTYQKTTTGVVCDSSNDINSHLTDQISPESQVKDEMLHRQQDSSTASSGPSSNQCLDDATIKLHERIAWATSQLGSSNSVEMDIKLSELICSCGQAIKTLKTLQKS